jgi:hypothetical protein
MIFAFMLAPENCAENFQQKRAKKPRPHLAMFGMNHFRQQPDMIGEFMAQSYGAKLLTPPNNSRSIRPQCS